MDRVHQYDQMPFEQLRSTAIAIREIDPQQSGTWASFFGMALSNTSYFFIWPGISICAAKRPDMTISGSIRPSPLAASFRLRRSADWCGAPMARTEFLTGLAHRVIASTLRLVNTSLGRRDLD